MSGLLFKFEVKALERFKFLKAKAKLLEPIMSDFIAPERNQLRILICWILVEVKSDVFEESLLGKGLRKLVEFSVGDLQTTNEITYIYNLL